MKNITINVFNTNDLQPKNYICSIEMPDYKQFKRIKTFLRKYARKQAAADFNQGRMRFYVFQSNKFTFTETELI